MASQVKTVPRQLESDEAVLGKHLDIFREDGPAAATQYLASLPEGQLDRIKPKISMSEVLFLNARAERSLSRHK